MKPPGVNVARRCHFESLCCRMIDFPKARVPKIPVEGQREWIEARAQNDNLCDSFLKRFACEASEAFLAQRIMTQNSGDGVFFDRLYDPKKPWLAGDSKEQSGCGWIRLKK